MMYDHIESFFDIFLQHCHLFAQKLNTLEDMGKQKG